MPFGGSNCFWSSLNLKGGGVFFVYAYNGFLLSCKKLTGEWSKPVKNIVERILLCMMSYRIYLQCICNVINVVYLMIVMLFYCVDFAFGKKETLNLI